MSVKTRGFASLPKDKQRELARKGGQAAHEKGTAHEWTSESARVAGMKGGAKSGAIKRAKKLERLIAEYSKTKEPQSAA